MENLKIAILIIMFITLFVIVIGIGMQAFCKKITNKNSTNLMVLRVVLQFVAVILAGVFCFLKY